MGRRWQHHNTDKNQKEIVAELRKLLGKDAVATGHDDILVGYQGQNYWFEIKNPNEITKTGDVRKSGSRQTRSKQKHTADTWPGQYQIVWTTEQILQVIGYPVSMSS